MLFQMCYGPEIQAVYESIRRRPGQDIAILTQQYQYKEGDVTSLINCVLIVLEDLQFIIKDGSRFFALEDRAWSNKEVFSRLQRTSRLVNNSEESLDYIFTTLYDQLFVKPDQLFVTNIHYQVNSKFNKTLVGHEKINAWKRMMECWGLGRRVYSGFYALPHLSLLYEIIAEVGEWEGALHPYCEKYIHPILSCITSEGNIYRGLIFGLKALHDQNVLTLSFRQDLPYKSYGQNNDWNWISFKKGEEILYDTVS